MELALVIIGILAIVGLIIFVAHKFEKARRRQLQAVADQLGLQFHPNGDTAIQNAIGQLRLFNQGHGRQTRNMLSGRTEDVDVAIFGYRYKTGGGKHQHTHQQTVISFQSSHLSLPEFELRPEHMFHKIGQAFGYKDIDVDSHPEFSKRYVLRSQNEGAIRDLFTPEILEFFESQKGVSIEAANDRLIYYRAGKRIKPENVRSLMEEGFRLYVLLKQV
jgi:carbonic anhydrase